ncbi:hypothetical protein H9623_02815 [Oerskovia sp. Sa1BUA8]|uniref:Uncharacterized protein n=1 Tax=Oerskovia douganii TaxID=2762210 RepID=A0A9D5U6P9_9CELL|nr:hypothetical protein [Oerskovia douganii]MBE7699238.1 hypothetical protein [Oerskovia douganii]
MGSKNVAEVYALWHSLPHRPFRLLVFMAFMALDESREGQAACLYWGGQERLGLAIGRPAPAKPDEDDLSPAAEDARRERRLVFEAVRTDVKKLIDAGAIERVRQGGYGGRSEYRLTLTQTPLQVGSTGTGNGQPGVPQTPSQPGSTDPTSGGVTGPISGGVTDPTSGGALLQETSTPLQQAESNMVPRSSSHQRARAVEEHQGPDEEYESARNELVAYGPRAHSLIAQIQGAYPETTLRDAVIEAAAALAIVAADDRRTA